MPTVTLNADERTALNEPLAGQGGFQDFIAKLRNNLRPTGELELTEADVNKIRDYRTKYGGGGWQDHLDQIFRRTLGPFE